MHVIALDAGTGSLRAVLFDDHGHEVAVAARPWTHQPEPGIPGSMTFTTNDNFTLLLDVLTEVVDRHPDLRHDITAISSASMREGLVVLDADDNELWACANVDSRAEQQVRELASDPAIQTSIYRSSGQTFALAAQPRLLWLAQNMPQTWARAAKVVMLSDWLLFRLGGRPVMEPSNGSTSGLLTLATRQADPQLLSICGLDKDLDIDVVEPGTVIGTLDAALAEQLGLNDDVRLVVGGGDTQLAALGAGLTHPGDALVVGGTFWQTLINIPQPLTDPDMRVRVNAAATPDTWQAEAIAFHVGTAVRWFRDTIAVEEAATATQHGTNALEVLNQRAAEIPIGSHGTTAVFSDAMNYARWRHASPSFIGLPLDQTPQQARATMYRALLENAAIVTAENFRLIQSFADVTPTEVVFAGGACNSRLWSQILADALGLPVRIPKVKETTALGAAICAATGAGLFTSLEEGSAAWTQWDYRLEPDSENQPAYRELTERWEAVYAPQLALVDNGITTSLWRAPGA